MITPRGTFRLLGVTNLLLIGTFFSATPITAAENRLRQQRSVSDARIPVDHARVHRRRVDADARPNAASRDAMVVQAAPGRAFDERQAASNERSSVGSAGQVRRAGFLDSAKGGCGPVCDCGHCDPVCGIEPVCGTEVFVDEPVCGIEVGCGIGAALEHLGPVCGVDGPACGIEGCVGCAEAACGIETVFTEGPGCGMEVVGDCGCDACASACDVDCFPLFLPIFRVNWHRFEFFAGSQGFKGPLNFVNTTAGNSSIRSGSGSFGFHQGFNRGHSLKHWLHCDLASQFGLRATQSNLSGAEFTEDTRYQIFLTYGLFRRVDYGFQYGLALDYLSGDWYYQADLLQLRGELSWKTRGCNLYGFQFMASVRDDTSATLVRDQTGSIIGSSIAMESTDQYRFFYRRLLPGNGDWDVFAGWTDRDDGLIGSTLSLPLRRNLVLQTGSTYLIPREGDSSGGHREEGWNVSLGLVWRPGGPNGVGRYSRPMFDVADNGTFMVDLK